MLLLEQDLLLGKEVFNFFTIHYTSGIISIIISCFLMFFVIYKILNIRLIHQIDNYSDFLQLLKNKYSFFNNDLFLLTINIFLGISFYVMIVGLSTLFHYQFGIKKLVITFIVILICYRIFKNNDLRFIYIFNSILMPILILFIIFLSVDGIYLDKINFYHHSNLFYSIFQGLLYFSYNSLLIIPILFKIEITNKKNNFILSIVFSCIIFILINLINLLLLSYFSEIQNIDLPILAICNSKNNIYSFFYFFIILSAILTTLFSSGFSFMLNIKEKNKKKILIIFLGLSFIFNYFSFSTLIDIFYPFFGLIGLIQIFLILHHKY